MDGEKIEKLKRGEIKLGEALNLTSEQVAALLLVGHQLYLQGRTAAARSIFEGLAAMDPKNPYVQSMLGVINQDEENYEAAIQRFTATLETHPQDIATLTNRGAVYLRLGKFKEAAADFKKAIDLDPKCDHPMANRARLMATVTREALKIAKEEGLDALGRVSDTIPRS